MDTAMPGHSPVAGQLPLRLRDRLDGLWQSLLAKDSGSGQQRLGGHRQCVHQRDEFSGGARVQAGQRPGGRVGRVHQGDGQRGHRLGRVERAEDGPLLLGECGTGRVPLRAEEADWAGKGTPSSAARTSRSTPVSWSAISPAEANRAAGSAWVARSSDAGDRTRPPRAPGSEPVPSRWRRRVRG